MTMRLLRCRSFLVAGFVFAILFESRPAFSVNLNATPSLSTSVNYDTNIFNTETTPASDYVFRANPRLTLSLAALRGTLNLNGGFQIERYKNHSELNSATTTKYFDLSVGEPVWLTPKLSVSPTAHYVQTRDSVRRGEIQQPQGAGGTVGSAQPVDSSVEPTAGVKEYSAGLQVSYLATANLAADVGGSWLKREFTGNNPNFVRSRTETGNAGLRYQVSSVWELGPFFDASRTRYDNRNEVRTYTGGVRTRRALSDRYVVDGRAGATYENGTEGGGDNTVNRWSPFGLLALGYNDERTHATLTGTYEVTGNNLGTTSRRTRATLAISKRLADQWSADGAGSFQYDRSTGVPSGIVLRTVEFMAGIGYQLTQLATLRLSGYTVTQRGSGALGLDVDRRIVSLEFILGNTYQIF